MTKKELSNAELEELIELADADPNVVNTWSEKTVIKVYSYMRKRGVLQKSNQYACMTFINWPEYLMQRFYLVAANAYIDRAITEHRMNGAPETECEILENFFRKKLCFNGAKHVMDGIDVGITREKVIEEMNIAESNDQSGSVPQLLTKEQKSIMTATRDSIRSAKNVIELVVGQLSNDKSFVELVEAKNKAEALLVQTGNNKTIKEIVGAMDNVINRYTNDSARRDVMRRRLDELQLANAKISNMLGDSSRDILKVLDFLPPVDNIHYFNRFCSDNYEHIRKLTSLAYNVPDDMETTIWFHGAADTLPKIEKFQQAIHKQCSLGAIIVGNAGATHIAPDLEPQESERKYGSATDVISSMIDAAEKSQNIVEKIVKKNIKDSRKKVILDDFKKNPVMRKKALMARKAGNKFDATGISNYTRLVGTFRPHNMADLDSDDEQEIVDELITENPEDFNAEDEHDEQDEGTKPIRVLGIGADGQFGEIDVKFDIPDEYAFEAAALQDSKKDIQQK